jgi:surfeit locus 1 family protein
MSSVASPSAPVARKSLVMPAILTGIAFCILLGLGTWQIERLGWKEGILAQIESRIHQQPVPPPSASVWASLEPADYEYRRVSVSGFFEHDNEALIFRPTGSVRGSLGPGYHVLTPLRLADGNRILVNRGFVPLDRKEPTTRLDGQIRDSVTVTGLMRAPEERNWFTPADDPPKRIWYTRDTPSIARALSLAGVAPFAIDSEDARVPGGLPQGGATQINVPNNHLSYALTWYGLAATLAGVFGVFIWRRRG